MVEYYDVQFHNIVVKGNGECEADLSDYYTPGENFRRTVIMDRKIMTIILIILMDSKHWMM